MNCFLCDESFLDRSISHAMRARGLDVETVVGLGFAGLDDEDVLALAKRLGRILVTIDDDFLALSAAEPDHPGIVFVRDEWTARALAEDLEVVARVADPSELRGTVRYLPF